MQPTAVMPGQNIDMAPGPFSRILSGKDAFYKAPDYFESTEGDLKSRVRMPVAFSYTIENRCVAHCQADFVDRDFSDWDLSSASYSCGENSAASGVDS